MKKILFVLAIVLLNSCAWEDNLNPYTPEIKYMSNDFYWYYDSILFKNVDSCQVVGVLENNMDDYMIHINYRCPVMNDTIYIIKKYLAVQNNIFNGVFYIRGKDPCRIVIELK